MASLLYTFQNVVDEVRSQLDEDNRDAVSTEEDILPALNRAQDYAFDILARKYPEPILKYQTLPLVGGQAEYPIPEDTFEDRIQKVEMQFPVSSVSGVGTFREIPRISYRDISDYESGSTSNVPEYYCIIGRKMRLIPAPTATYPLRLWTLRNPEKPKLPQGRITFVNETSNYVIVDSIGEDLTTEADQLGSYVNVIDGQTGEVKGTFQLQIIAQNKLAFRSVPTRATVLNREVSGSMLELGITQDDYICAIDGTCVPYYNKPIVNFIIQYATAELTRKLGGAADMEERVLEKFEKQVERVWVKQETTLRIKKKNNAWGPVPSVRLWRR